MKVLLAPADDHGCGFYRMRAPAAALENEAGLDIEFVEGFKALKGVVSGTIRGLEEPVEADVIVLQRPLARHLAALIPFFQKQGIAVVVDIDDDFSCLHSRHPSWPHVHPRYSPDNNWHHLKAACAAADLVTCSTLALAGRYGSRGNAIVLPNYVPEWYLNVPKLPNMTPCVGWAGFTKMHPGDLTATRGGVAEALATLGGKFLAIGDGEDVARDLELLDDDVVITGPVPIEQYPITVARLDVGIVPLLPSAFNTAKSWLKGLEYAALGVPFVASMTAEYESLAERLGFLAAQRGRDWRRMITFAYRNREEYGPAGRELVREHYTYERNGWMWPEAWAEAMYRKAGASLAR